jgi:hypothetical protein
MEAERPFDVEIGGGSPQGEARTAAAKLSEFAVVLDSFAAAVEAAASQLFREKAEPAFGPA